MPNLAQAHGDAGPSTLTLISPERQSQIMSFSLQGARPRSPFQHRPLLDLGPQLLSTRLSALTNSQCLPLDSNHSARTGLPGQIGINGSNDLLGPAGQAGLTMQPSTSGQNGLNGTSGLNIQPSTSGQNGLNGTSVFNMQPSTSRPNMISEQNGPNGTNGLNMQPLASGQTQASPGGQQGSPQSSLILKNFNPQDCSNCGKDHKAFAVCPECSEFLCLACIEAHARKLFTKKHQLFRVRSLSDDALSEDLAQITATLANQQLSPSSFNPPSSKVVGAERISSNTSNTSTESSPTMFHPGNPLARSIENIVAVTNRRASIELSPSNQVSNGHVNLLGYPVTPSPSTAYPPTTPSPPSTYPLIFPSQSNIFRPVRPLSNRASTSSDSGASSISQGESGDANNENMALALPDSVLPPCSLHQMPFIFFCERCVVPVCNVCVQQSHNDHHMSDLSHSLGRARRISDEMKNEIRKLNLGLRTNLDNLQHTCERIDVQAHQAARSIRYIIKQVIAALETREQDLLRRVEQGRQMKLRLIGYQMDNIGLHFSRLARASDLINGSNGSLDNFQIMSVNYQVSRELKHARNLGIIHPCEDDTFKFTPPDDVYLQSILQLGNLQISTSTLADAIRLYRHPFLNRMLPIDKALLPNQLPQSRPIYGCPKTVAVKDFGKTPKKIWGKPGTGNGFLCRPWGITMNRFGQIIISDRSNHRIQVFDSEGNYLFHFGSHGTGNGQFDRPASVAINPNDDIIVTDKDNHRVQVFTRTGEFLLAFGDRGSQIGQFLYPWDVAVDSQGNILVSDTRNHRIQLFKWNGIFIAKWGGDWYGGMARLFDSPRGVTFDPHGNILVTDFNLHKVIMINRLNGVMRFIGTEGSERGDFNRPQGICCDDRGWFIVADSRNYRYQVFNEKGEFMWMVGKNGKEDPGEFDRPVDMCIDPDGHIHLMDFGNDRVQVF